MSARVFCSTYTVNNTKPCESTEPAAVAHYNKAAPYLAAPSQPTLLEEDVWWQINQEFACEQEDEYLAPLPILPSAAASPQKTIVVVARSESHMDENDWTAMNSDFACENDMDVEVSTLSSNKSTSTFASTCVDENNLGDYGIWWE